MELTFEAFVSIAAMFLGLVQVVISLYIIILNYRNRANQHVSLLLMLFALNGIGLGLLIRAQSPQEARIPMALVAATTTSNQPFLFLAAVAMLRVRWFSSRVRWPLYFFYLLGALPIILTVIDLILGTNLWFSGAPANSV